MLKFRGASGDGFMNKKKLEEHGKVNGLLIELAPDPVFGWGSLALPVQIITLVVAFRFASRDFQYIDLQTVRHIVLVIIATIPTFFVAYWLSYKYFDEHRLAPIAQMVSELYFYTLNSVIVAWVLYLIGRAIFL